MTQIHYRIRLVSDAEPATGLGGGTLDSLVPRDSQKVPFFPSSHIKGLMRAALRSIAAHRVAWREAFGGAESDWPLPLLERVFGHEEEDDKSYDALVRVDAASLVDQDPLDFETLLVSRTAIAESGIAEPMSLRTTEAIPSESVFKGTIYSDVASDSVEGIAWRLALVSISAVGSSRNRTGQCVVDLLDINDNPTDLMPDQLLRDLDVAISEKRFHRRELNQQHRWADIGTLEKQSTVIELMFAAATPVCVPERPDRSNVITSGFCIPATAVQGVLLHHVSKLNPKLGDELFAATNFRCWPLNPCGQIEDAVGMEIEKPDNRLFDQLPNSVRISLSHRSAKFYLGDVCENHFFEPAFGDRADAYRWPDVPDNAPLKASDGVLLVTPVPGTRRLWKASEMPRHLTTHGVSDGPATASEDRRAGRNLYSVEAMMPMYWRGIVTLPSNLAESFVTSINQREEYRFGKGRSVRGRGRLIARIMPADATSLLNATPADGGDNQDRTALILQSPVAVPRSLHSKGMSADDVLREIAASWLKTRGLPSLAEKPATWASVGLRFGWNRHDGDRPFQEAVPVLQPGSVFTLSELANPADLQAALIAGFHHDSHDAVEEKQKGHGALAVHPGIATGFYQSPRTSPEIGNRTLAEAMRIVDGLRSRSHLPSPSQIRGVQQRIATIGPHDEQRESLNAAKSHLATQQVQRPDVRLAWDPIADEVGRVLSDFTPEIAHRALKTLADIASVQRDEKEARK